MLRIEDGNQRILYLNLIGNLKDSADSSDENVESKRSSGTKKMPLEIEKWGKERFIGPLLISSLGILFTYSSVILAIIAVQIFV